MSAARRTHGPYAVLMFPAFFSGNWKTIIGIAVSSQEDGTWLLIIGVGLVALQIGWIDYGPPQV